MHRVGAKSIARVDSPSYRTPFIRIVHMRQWHISRSQNFDATVIGVASEKIEELRNAFKMLKRSARYTAMSVGRAFVLHFAHEGQDRFAVELTTVFDGQNKI